ncbi:MULTISPECIES: hypothetical protein [unclassified Chelatococcus]|uniref:hypothetical protein n=1 Tax=unclassified Chelatococcus TaxID=2638111 RepID=UPI001BCB6ABF|nr:MULTISPECIES: hypothetical protein [unclassified Chelatococcus]CAH1657282.1 conserved hypothetical protein [Hyphomicrobiales bacterium]MBS7740659.1 hypothetical protein [Chelatococcus sp. HY11]MBX3544557.1 hypothetical protein [Chelatococcus sp.]MCO5079855.1 hypothetical protein [Chelatococcus sp.]CAH1684476.1 conserved hypothetical protein [Hyphomicrobiales bacterium]
MIDCYSLSSDEAHVRGNVDEFNPPSQRQVDFWNTLRSHSVYASALNDEYQLRGNWSFYSSQTTRRKTKGGLHWAARGRFNIAVHFILDDLDLRAVVEKNATWGDGEKIDYVERGRKRRACTGAELRWIYRNQTDALVRNTVQFWKNFRPVAPPWEPGHLGWSEARLWSHYVPRSWGGKFKV